VDSQWREAKAHRGGPLVILGTAGSGKTTLVAERFEWLVDQGCAPEQIGVVAPSAGRADALRVRIESALARGYEELAVGTPLELAVRILGPSAEPPLTAGDRLAMLLERVDELTLAHHDFGGSATALFGRFIRRIDGLKAELVGADQFASSVANGSASELEFAEVYRTHERMLADACARDAGDLIRDALGKLERSGEQPFERSSSCALRAERACS
jgi:DNA helicase-2/ATP-dependent DNA helicase PcrA